jgi:DNA-binding CsgD family transcriptional regulator
MYISVMFISYIAATFIALLGIGIVLLLLSKGENRSSKQYQTVMSFAVIVFAQCLLYCFFYFRDMIMGEPAVGMPLRLIDYLICGAIFFFWLRVIDILEPHRKNMIRSWAWIIGIFIAAPGMAATAFFMDNYYCFASKSIGNAYSIIEIIYTVLTVLVISKYAFDFVRYSVSRSGKTYVIVVSVVLLFWNIQQISVDTSLYFGVYKSAWLSGVIDSTGIVMFISGLATFLYVFREDFSPLYYAKPAEDTPPDPIEATAQQHGLTVRELEVLKLVYTGLNNPEIAGELFISRNTVKKHLQNIFEKTGTNSRMELIYIINMKNGQNAKNNPPGL